MGAFGSANSSQSSSLPAWRTGIAVQEAILSCGCAQQFGVHLGKRLRTFYAVHALKHEPFAMSLIFVDLGPMSWEAPWSSETLEGRLLSILDFGILEIAERWRGVHKSPTGSVRESSQHRLWLSSAASHSGRTPAGAGSLNQTKSIQAHRDYSPPNLKSC